MKHLNVQDIINQNLIALDNSTKLVNSTEEKLRKLSELHFRSNEREQKRLDKQISELVKYQTENKKHFDMCLESLEHAKSLQKA